MKLFLQIIFITALNLQSESSFLINIQSDTKFIAIDDLEPGNVVMFQRFSFNVLVKQKCCDIYSRRKKEKMYRHFLTGDNLKTQMMTVSLYQLRAKSVHDLGEERIDVTALIKQFEPTKVKIFTSSNKGIYFDDTSSESDHGSRRHSQSILDILHKNLYQ